MQVFGDSVFSRFNPYMSAQVPGRADGKRARAVDSHQRTGKGHHLPNATQRRAHGQFRRARQTHPRNAA
jgi:hypothetical protein